MGLENYRDLSKTGSDISAGFQFEFYCAHCSRKWKSPFKAHRMGQLSGFLARFSYLFSDMRTSVRATTGAAEVGSRGARDKALAEAQAQAASMFSVCQECKQAACADCFSPNDEMCLPCLEQSRREAHRSGEQAASAAREVARFSCPNCGTGHAGARFCAECGFDMASTHKSCPGCGTMQLRQARFCTDCGHGF